MKMKASVTGRVRNTVLPRAKPLLPVFEAVINAFKQSTRQAGRTGIASEFTAPGSAA